MFSVGLRQIDKRIPFFIFIYFLFFDIHESMNFACFKSSDFKKQNISEWFNCVKREIENDLKAPGGHSNDKSGYQVSGFSMTHKKHPKHVCPPLKFAPLNRLAMGFDTPNKYFSFFQP